MFERRNVLGLIRNFVTFESDDKGRTAKIIAGYHQFHAVNVAVS
jgi:type I restriction enzyme R subunit